MSVKVNITKGHLHAFNLILGKDVIFRPSNVTWKLMDIDDYGLIRSKDKLTILTNLS
jgi:hypothetical protein